MHLLLFISFFSFSTQSEFYTQYSAAKARDSSIVFWLIDDVGQLGANLSESDRHRGVMT